VNQIISKLSNESNFERSQDGEMFVTGLSNNILNKIDKGNDSSTNLENFLE
jgi:hypothetical protein